MRELAKRRALFETTSWSLILMASDAELPGSEAALSDLCNRYWYPVYAFIRRQGYDATAAEDLTQGFFTRLLEKQYVRQAEQSRGRFRSFLLGAVKHFLSNERQRQLAQKRGGDRKVLSFDSEAAVEMYQEDSASPLTPEQLFDKRWALEVLERVTAEIRAKAKGEGREAQVERLLPFLTGEASRRSYSELASSLGTTEGALRVAVHRLRRHFREGLRNVIAATVTDPRDLDDEIRFLIDAVSADGQSRGQTAI